MKKTLLLNSLLTGFLGSVLLVAGCKKDMVKTPGTDTGNPKLKTQSAGDNKYDLLGFGYDATGEYASSNSATYQVIDIDKLVQNEPGRYVPDVNVTQYAEYAAGGNASDYLHSLTSNTTATLSPLGLSSFWGATLTVNFHETSKISSKYSYASASVIIKQKRLKFNAPIDLIKSTYLTSIFKSDVSAMSAQQLVTKYGTHVLTDIVLGAKLNVFYRSQSSSSNRGLSVKAGLDVHGLFHTFGIKSDVTYADSSVNSNYDQTMYYSTVGGDGTKGVFGQLSLDNTAPKVDITAWQSSCTRDNAAFIQISNVAGAAIPLQDLIDDPAKKQAVADYIAQYITGKQITLADVLATIGSKQFYNVFLRMDGSKFVSNSAGSGVVNAQYSAGPYEKMLFTKQPDGTYVIESNYFPGLFLRMDGSSVPNNPANGAGIVNLNNPVGPWERFNITKQSDGTYTIQSAAFANTYLRIDGSGLNSFNGNGGGRVNCQKPTPGPWEKFVIKPDLY
ncbi:MAC/perforin domain-containing protein [Mucilaginibacter sp. 22184]|uniref:MAC/perforin domain-containing protein n=1 Tax=Mucilaginibacter sp. 22184 TaxID=3453887 RepID=UPI003F87AADC